MGNVSIVVVRVVGIIMVIVMKVHFSNRFHQSIHMRCRHKVEGNVIKIEDKQRGYQQTTPPARLGQRAPGIELAASSHQSNCESN